MFTCTWPWCLMGEWKERRCSPWPWLWTLGWVCWHGFGEQKNSFSVWERVSGVAGSPGLSDGTPEPCPGLVRRVPSCPGSCPRRGGAWGDVSVQTVLRTGLCPSDLGSRQPVSPEEEGLLLVCEVGWWVSVWGDYFLCGLFL